VATRAKSRRERDARSLRRISCRREGGSDGNRNVTVELPQMRRPDRVLKQMARS
jgi:hypothetical protein